MFDFIKKKMKITDDQIIVEQSDILVLSERLQKDVAFRAGPQTTPHEYLSVRFNEVLDEASNVTLKAGLEEVNEICVALVKADKLTQDQIKTLLKI